MRKTVPEQFHSLRKRSGLSLAELARRMGFKRPSSIQRYDSGADFRGEYLSAAVVHRLAQAIVGLGMPPIAEREVLALGGPLMSRRDRTVPVISYVHAGRWTSAVDAYVLGEGFDEIHVDRSVGPGAFALEIKGDSMIPRFAEGDRIVIDPGIQPRPGDFVVAKEDRQGDATFKQFRPRGEDSRGRPIIELRPLNDLWPTLTLDAKNPGRIIGTMVEHHSYRRTN